MGEPIVGEMFFEYSEGGGEVVAMSDSGKVVAFGQAVSTYILNSAGYVAGCA